MPSSTRALGLTIGIAASACLGSAARHVVWEVVGGKSDERSAKNSSGFLRRETAGADLALGSALKH